MLKNKGFSLIELLIVVAIILIIAAIAIPNLARARMSANESSAASAIRSITDAEISYYSMFPDIGYAAVIINMGHTVPCTPAPTHACLLDNNLATAIPGSTGHSGYVFSATGISGGSPINADYVAGGAPLNAGTTGTRDFCAVTDAVLRFQPALGAAPANTLAGCLTFPVAN